MLAGLSPVEGLCFIWSMESRNYHNSSANRNIMMFASVLLDLIWKYRNKPTAWEPTLAGWIKINLDAVVINDEASIAYVARDAGGSVIKWVAQRVSTLFPLVAEAFAANFAMELVVAEWWPNVVFTSDSKIVVDVLNAFSETPWSIASAIENCSFKLSSEACWSFLCTPRLCNFMAHNIARWCLFCDSNSYLSSVLPPIMLFNTSKWSL
ncbi:hypothetical protein UlMin_014419 [Ulmus minor]